MPTPTMETLTINDTTFDVVDDEAVRFTEQTLTDPQKKQACENIGAAKEGGIVDFMTVRTTNVLLYGRNNNNAYLSTYFENGMPILSLSSVSDDPLRFNGIETPIDNNDAANKRYVDTTMAKLEYYIADRDSLTINTAGVSFNGSAPTKIPDIDSAYIHDLYDDLATAAEARGISVTSRTLPPTGEGTGANEIREYVFSAGDYTESPYGIPDDIHKPTFLVTAGIHGDEVTTVLATYKFFEDLVHGRNLPSYLAEGAIFKVVPVVNPSGFDARVSTSIKLLDSNNEPAETATTQNIRTRTTNRTADNGETITVDLNRNFDYQWKKYTPKEKQWNYFSGNSAASEPETNAIADWLEANKDAVVLLDMHCSTFVDEYVGIMGSRYSLATTRAKKIALRGVDKVVPYWKSRLDDTSGIIFHYSCCLDSDTNPVIGAETYYASEVLGIPAFALECVSDTQTALRTSDNIKVIAEDKPNENTVAIGAEILGNILLESYKQEL